MRKLAVLCSLLAASIAGEALAAADAYDDASDPVYDNGFQVGASTGDNGGFGWGGPWTSIGFVLPTIGSSTANGDPDMDGDIDTQGMRAFRFATSAGGAQNITVRRPFSGALAIGDRVSYDFDHDPLVLAGYVSMELWTATQRRFGFGWYGSDPDGEYGIADADGGPLRTIALALTDEPMHVEFTLTGTDTYQLQVTPTGGSTLTETGTLTNAGSIVTFRLSANGDGTPRQSYFNRIGVNVVPEPAAALGGWAVLGALVIAKRRRA